MSSRRLHEEAPSRSGGLRRILSAFTVVGLAIAAAVAAPLAASAAPNPNVIVTDVILTSADGAQATVGDTLTVSGSWDASAADPMPGDTFTIGLPPELGFAQPVPFNLSGPDPSGEIVIWATCLTDPSTAVATCTFTDEVLANSEVVLGDFSFDVEAKLATTAEDVVFNLNGAEVAVPLPGGGGIDDGVELPTDWTKKGALNADKWSMKWTIELPGSRLAGEDVVNILEDLSDNHVLCTPSNLRIETVRGSTVVDVTGIGSTSTDVSDPYEFQITLTAPQAGFDAGVTYRITYDTCTPDGEIDPTGTVYENEATVDIWGESSGVVGVTQDWSFTGQIDKQGTVLGGADRNGKVLWTVTVAGDHLVGQDEVSVSEVLSGPHALCTDTISGIRVFERYGPSSNLQTEITGELDVTTVSSSATGFEVLLTIAGDSDFAFKPSDHLYLIQYRTCATTDGLPEAGTAFGNAVNVDGATDGSQATVPGRTDRKAGAINSSSVTVDGVTYLPQTTLNWNITVPGENLADIGSELTVSDTLTSAHQVCVGSGGDIPARLGLKVEARDQIQNGGLATVNLTSSVTAALDGADITITIPEPTLALPGGGSETGFSREYQYVITYTTCTTSGGMDAPGTTYGNSAEVAGKTYTQTITQSNRGSGTGQGMPRGTVAITKTLADTAGAAFVPAATAFSVHVKEIDPQGTVQLEYDLSVPLDGAPVSGLNARGLGWKIELSEPTFPSVPGVTFGAPVFAPGPGITLSAGGTVATAALVPASNIAVALENSAQLGSLEVVKAIDGGAASLVDPDRTYAMTAAIDVSALGPNFPAQPARQFELTANDDPYVLEDLPIGASVTITEAVPAADDLLTWGVPTITPATIQIVPGHVADPATVTVTNHVERTVGSFSLVKEVTGAEAENPAVPDTVTVTASWVQDGVPGGATLVVPTDGTPVPLGAQLLIGTEVTLTETPLADASGIAWGAPVWSGTGVEVDGTSAVVTIGRDADALVTLENHAATSTAGISLIKGIAGEAAAEVDAETEFPVTARWTDDEGVEQSKDLLINAVEPVSLGEDLPAGTVVTLTEGERPEIDTVVWGSITISGTDVDDAGDGSATVVVSDQQDDVTLVSVVNEATWAPGTFSLSKTVEGVLLDNPDVPETVTVVATWFDGDEQQSQELSVPVDGTTVPFGEDLPRGTEVTLTEVPLEPSASFTWADPQWDGDAVEGQPDGSAIVTIGAAADTAIDLVNTAVPLTGSLALTKALSGDGASDVASGTAFAFTASWTDLLGQPQQVTVEVTAGSPVVIEDVPLGTEVKVVEGSAELPSGVRWDGVSWTTASDDVTLSSENGAALIAIVGEQGVEAALAATNEFTALPGLAVTGGTFAIAGILAAAVGIIAGAVLMILRRRNAEARG
ncbi:DUF5979 domain-containing protein [Microbacterium sp.]|uniref:DUF5979 domain-containing protein n=1 Tax=Microbacterium sp. TaxID=51671 RepID=UPI002810E363|nr:DUF5979 domain-containing protein [Microbacterium sp.]